MHARIEKKREDIARGRILAADEVVLRSLDTFEDSWGLFKSAGLSIPFDEMRKLVLETDPATSEGAEVRKLIASSLRSLSSSLEGKLFELEKQRPTEDIVGEKRTLQLNLRAHRNGQIELPHPEEDERRIRELEAELMRRGHPANHGGI